MKSPFVDFLRDNLKYSNIAVKCESENIQSTTQPLKIKCTILQNQFS